tara:strand:+ start:9461 stop:10591 length:1131 start_codon:yes stop_codon:yes gene_type:complete
MTIQLTTLMQQRRDTAANWTTNNPTLLSGELGFESDTNKMKIGDGSTAWTSLGYIPSFSFSGYPLATADISDDAITGDKLANDITIANDLTVTNRLTVNGTLTTINSTTLQVNDKNIELGTVATPTDTTADGGGITLKGATDHTITWINSTDSWDFSEHVNAASGKEFKINGTSVLSSSSLGSGVTASSLTSVGTLSSGTWSASTIAVDKGGTGQTSYTDGQLLIGNTSGNTLSKATLTAGSNITITNGNGTITIAASGGTSVSAGDGIDVSGSEVSVDLKANGGLTIESTELAVDLAASSITGTLPVTKLTSVTSTAAELNIVDGSTSATSTTLAAADRMVINDAGTMVQVALSDLVTFLENATASSFELDGGSF